MVAGAVLLRRFVRWGRRGSVLEAEWVWEVHFVMLAARWGDARVWRAVMWVVSWEAGVSVVISGALRFFELCAGRISCEEVMLVLRFRSAIGWNQVRGGNNTVLISAIAFHSLTAAFSASFHVSWPEEVLIFPSSSMSARSFAAIRHF